MAERPPLPPTGSPSAGTEPGLEVGWPYLPSVNPNCFESLGPANAPPSKTTIADAVKSPQPIEHESDAFVVFRGACHFGAHKSGGECRPFIVLSDTRNAGIKSAMTPSLDLVVFVDDSSRWEQFSAYRVRYGFCSLEPGALAARAIGIPTAR